MPDWETWVRAGVISGLLVSLVSVLHALIALKQAVITRTTRSITPTRIFGELQRIASTIDPPDIIIGIGRGGSIVAGIMAHFLQSKDAVRNGGNPIKTLTLPWEGSRDNRRIVPPVGYETYVCDKKVLLATAEDWTGGNVASARKLLDGEAREVEALSLYSLNCEVRSSECDLEQGDYSRLPEFVAIRINGNRKRKMPWS